MKNKILILNSYCKKVEEFLLVATIGTMTFLLVSGVVMRFIFNESLAFSEELGSMMLIAAAYIGSPYAVRQSKHIRMVFLSELCSVRFTKILNYFTCLLAGIAFIAFGLMCGEYMLKVMASGRTFMTLHWPRWIVWIPVCLGLILTGVQYFIVLFLNIADRKNITSKADIWIGSECRMGEDKTC